MNAEIKPIDRIVGEIQVPGDKSISHRAVMIGAISEGTTRADNFLTSEDCMRTVDAFKKMQTDIELDGNAVRIAGRGLRGLKKPSKALYLGNSGTTMRLIPGILSGQDFEVLLTGDESLSRRPMGRIIEPLTLMGAGISAVNNNGCAPLKIKGGRLKPIKYETNVASAQVKSCVLLAGLYADGETAAKEPLQSRDHTERMLKLFGAAVERKGLLTSIKGGALMKGKHIFIPGDISAAAFFIVLALILEGSRLKIRDVGINPTRRRIIDVLSRMGGDIVIKNEKMRFEPFCDMEIRASDLKGTVVKEEEIPQMIDEVPILAVAAAMASGVTEIHGIGELRVKETDRVFSIEDNLKKLGVEIRVRNNSLFITGRKKRFLLQKKDGRDIPLKSFGDHRTAMAMSVAAAASEGTCTITDTDCINTSFPHFFDILNTLKR